MGPNNNLRWVLETRKVESREFLVPSVEIKSFLGMKECPRNIFFGFGEGKIIKGSELSTLLLEGITLRQYCRCIPLGSRDGDHVVEVN